MGILNITPDSFSDGGHIRDVDDALRRADAMVQAGASIIDVGGESTRPGALPVDAETETQRVMPMIEALVRADLPARISIDTTKPAVARAALEQGAHIVNDISALRDPQMAAAVARHRAGLILMHMQGTPQTMQDAPVYHNVVQQVHTSLLQARDRALAAGVAPEHIWLDPGIGFGKTLAHNLALLRALRSLCAAGHPVVLGVSRKGFLGALTGHTVAQDRDAATAAACVVAYTQGARIFRVHNVGLVAEALHVAEAIAL